MFRKIKPICLTKTENISKRLIALATTEEIILESVKDVGIITLNRPKALNALNLSMLRQLLPILKEWEREKAVVIMRGAGGKAFCAGGDAVSVVESSKNRDGLAAQLFKTMYTINALVGAYKKPYVALMDGITMGGGAGLSVHGCYRVATEKSIFAMPETSLGLFPDVGSSYFLPRLQGKLGLYLGLTGYRLTGSNLVKAGIATHYCESVRLNDLQADLVECQHETDVIKSLDKFHINDNVPFVLEKHMDQINACFSAPSVEGIVSRLEEDYSDWSKSTLKAMRKLSPTSMKLTFRQLQRGADLRSLAECLEMEYRMAVHCIDNPDLHEGVRAVLLDKDHKPSWTPSQLEVVTEEHVERFFRRLSIDEELRLVQSCRR